MLLERTREQNELRDLLDRAADGTGGMVVLEGPAGIGKTGLLSFAQATAAGMGMIVGRARGGSLEQEFAYGAVRQLLEPLVAASADRERLFQGAAATAEPALTGTGSGDPGAVLHGLYWLTVALAEANPLVLVCDDLHWWDAPSLRYLAYVTHRVDEIAVAIVAATRPAEPGAGGELLGRMLAENDAVVLRLDPLSESAVGAIVRGSMDADADDAFCRAVAEVTRGNPFLVAELVRAVTTAGLAAEAGNAAHVGDMATGAAVLGRVGRLPPDALEVARAVAILGADAHLRHAAKLAGMTVDEASTAADYLLRAEILGPERPLAFIHPLVATAVYHDLLPGDRARRHRRAADMLAAEDAPAERVATHLLASEAAGDPWTVDILVQAARKASTQGATDVAVRYLRRALEEPPGADARFDVVFELGTAEALVSDPGAIDHLGEVLATLDDPEVRLPLAVLRALTLALRDRQKEAIAAMEGLGGDPLDQLAATVLIGVTGPAAAELVPDAIADLRRVPGDADASPLVLGVRSFIGALANEPAEAMAATARRALAAHPAEDPTLALWFHLPVVALVMADHVDEASTAIEAGLASARRLGAPSHLGVTLFMRSWLAFRQGELADAEADARAALELQQLHGSNFLIPGPVAILVDVLRERNDLDGADALLTQFGYATEDGDSLFHLFLLRARSRLRGAQGRWEERLADALRGVERFSANGGTSPGFLGFHGDIATSYLMSGSATQARKVAREGLELARAFGAPRALAEALRVAALVEPPEVARGMFEEAVAAAKQAGARLEEAWTLYSLGASKRRWRDISGARETDAECLQLAERCGSALLADWARKELLAAGARPRRAQLVGPASLTPSERRVADLAASGRTNKEVAQDLFLTVKTVETHLARTFQKLQISSRTQLAGKLAEPA